MENPQKDTAIIFTTDGRYYVGDILAPHYNTCTEAKRISAYMALRCPYCDASPMNIPKQFGYDKFTLPPPSGLTLQEFCQTAEIDYPLS